MCASYHSALLGLIGLHQEAVDEARRAVGLDSSAYLPRMVSVFAHQWAGDGNSALAAAEVALRVSGRSPNTLAELSGIYAARGDFRRALAAHQELLSRASTTWVDPTFLAISALGAGEADEAMKHAFHAIEVNAPHQLWLLRRPGTEALHAHPSYLELRNRAGL